MESHSIQNHGPIAEVHQIVAAYMDPLYTHETSDLLPKEKASQ